MPKLPKLPKKFTSTHAQLEISNGRDAIQKHIEADYKIPVLVKGYLYPGRGNVGNADDVGTEFAMKVEHVQIGKPEFVPLDTAGRPWAMAKDVKAGDKLQCDGGFTCMKAGTKKTVKTDKTASGVSRLRLYVCCNDGRHSLDGQLGKHGELIGLYKVS